jgi:hypothetical protein
MPHQTFKIKPGVEVNETPVLNQSGISDCQLIRFKFDSQGGGLVEKLGGWTRYAPPIQIPSPPRAMWAWEDLDADSWFVVGMESYSPPLTGPSGLVTYSATEEAGEGGPFDITPLYLGDDSTVNFATTAGSPIVTIIDSNTPALTIYDTVYITEQVAIGGIVLFGQYPIYAFITAGKFQIIAKNLLGAPNPAITTVAAPGGAVPSITTTAATAYAAVHLAAHGYAVGNTFTVLVATTVGGVVLFGDYTIYSVQGVNDFTIAIPTTAATTQTASINGGNIRLIYNIGGTPATSATGYGVGPFGGGGYGTGVTVPVNPGSKVNATDWALDNWGQTLLVCPENSAVLGIPVSGIYEWTPDGGQALATLIPQAPPVNDGFFLAMPQRQVVAWGSTFTGIQDPLLIRWCDVNDYNDWTATITNQAGSYRIPKGSKIVACLQSSQQALIWTDIAVWSMQYISQPYIYGFNEISTGCGLIAQKACGTLFGVTYWMSQSQFFKLGAGGVEPMPCPIWDVIFQNLNKAQTDKIRFAPNSQFNEVAWYYPSKNSAENDSYVKYNTLLNAWDFGSLPRSAWINQSVLGPPIGADPKALVLYQHETSPDAAGQPLVSWFKTGFFALSDADLKTFIDEVWPDMKWGYYGSQPSATVKLSFGVKDFPSQQPYIIGPFNLTQSTDFISPRVRGRLVQITLLSNDLGTFWRTGGLRYRGAPDGRY